MFCTLGAIIGMILGFEVVSLNSGLPRRLLSLLSSVRWWILPYLQRRKSLLLFPSGSALPSPSFYWTGGQNEAQFIMAPTIYFLLSREKKRLTFDSIPDFGAWQAVVLVLVGLVGTFKIFSFIYQPSRLAGSSVLSRAVVLTSAPSQCSLSCSGAMMVAMTKEMFILWSLHFFT